MVKLTPTFYPASVEPLGRAQNGDFRQLAARLRAGRSCQDELNLAADIVERAIKPRRGPVTSYDLLLRNLKVYEFVQDYLERNKIDDLPTKEEKRKAVRAAMKKFQKGRTTIFDALKMVKK